MSDQPAKRGRPKKEVSDTKLPIKYSASLADFICDKIEDGMTLKAVCEKFGSMLPDEKNIYKWKRKYPEFKEKLDNAYHTFFIKLIDEIKYLSELDIPEELSPAEKNLLIKQRDQKIKANQFLLVKIAPIFVKDMERKQEPAVNISLPPIQIISYKDIQPIPIESK